jgi:hypothetical protein
VTSNITIPCKAENLNPDMPEIDVKFYSILYNYTLMPNAFLSNWTAPALPDPGMLIIKSSVDSGIYDYLKAEKRRKMNIGLDFDDLDDPLEDEEKLDTHIDVSWSHFPLTTSRVFKDADISSLAGSFYISLGPLVTFVTLLTEIVKEKELKLRQGLSVVGLSHASYWLHWILTGMFF